MTWNTRPVIDPWLAYKAHMNRAKQRGIVFDLTLEEWWSVWSEHWDQRCRGVRLVMCRTLDQGGYTLGNVRIATIAENTKEGRDKKCQQLTQISVRD